MKDENRRASEWTTPYDWVVRQLLAAGARRDVKSEAGLLPLDFAAEGGEIETLVRPEADA